MNVTWPGSRQVQKSQTSIIAREHENGLIKLLICNHRKLMHGLNDGRGVDLVSFDRLLGIFLSDLQDVCLASS